MHAGVARQNAGCGDRVKKAHPMATAPVMSVMDMEYAGDTVLMARPKRVAEQLLRATEEIAGYYGLKCTRANR